MKLKTLSNLLYSKIEKEIGTGLKVNSEKLIFFIQNNKGRTLRQKAKNTCINKLYVQVMENTKMEIW